MSLNRISPARSQWRESNIPIKGERQASLTARATRTCDYVQSCNSNFSYCCINRLSDGQLLKKYNMVTKFASICTCNSQLIHRFLTVRFFLACVDITMKSFTNCQRWMRAVIKTAAGTNLTSVFRCSIQVIVEQVTRAGGANAVLRLESSTLKGSRRRSSPLNSELYEI